MLLHRLLPEPMGGHMGEVICAFGYHRLEETPFIWCEGIGGKS